MNREQLNMLVASVRQQLEYITLERRAIVNEVQIIRQVLTDDKTKLEILDREKARLFHLLLEIQTRIREL